MDVDQRLCLNEIDLCEVYDRLECLWVRDESKKTVQRLVEMEAGYLTVEVFRKINDEANRTGPNAEKDKEKDKRKDKVIENFSDHHLRKIGT